MCRHFMHECNMVCYRSSTDGVARHTCICKASGCVCVCVHVSLAIVMLPGVDMPCPAFAVVALGVSWYFFGGVVVGVS